MLDISELLRSTNRSYQITRGSPRGSLQLSLVFKEEKEGGYFEIWNKGALFMGYTEEKLSTCEISRIIVGIINKENTHL